MTEREELRKLAEAATPGPWSLTDGDPAMNGQHWTIRRQGVAGIRVSGFTYGSNGDAEFIAAANPAAVLGLLDQLDAAEAKLAAVRALHFGEYVEDDDRNRCFECGDEWPCPTIRALDGEAAHQLATEGTDHE